MKTCSFQFLSLLLAIVMGPVVVAADGEAKAAPAKAPAPAEPGAMVAVPLGEWKVAGWAGCQPVPGDDGSMRLTLTEKAADWCGAAFAGRQFAIPAGKFANGSLRFCVNGSANERGEHIGGQSLQVKLEGVDADDKPLATKSYLPIKQYLDGGRVDTALNTWQEVKIPLKKLEMDGCAAITKILFQYQTIGGNRAGVAIKDMAVTQ